MQAGSPSGNAGAAEKRLGCRSLVVATKLGQGGSPARDPLAITNDAAIVVGLDGGAAIVSLPPSASDDPKVAGPADGGIACHAPRVECVRSKPSALVRGSWTWRSPALPPTSDRPQQRYVAHAPPVRERFGSGENPSVAPLRRTRRFPASIFPHGSDQARSGQRPGSRSAS